MITYPVFLYMHLVPHILFLFLTICTLYVWLFVCVNVDLTCQAAVRSSASQAQLEKYEQEMTTLRLKHQLDLKVVYYHTELFFFFFQFYLPDP